MVDLDLFYRGSSFPAVASRSAKEVDTCLLGRKSLTGTEALGKQNWQVAMMEGNLQHQRQRRG